MGLGTVSLNAQVRIGGNAAPNASALLDLNATDATNNGTKGLALPRVNLTSSTMLLSGVTSNLTGMMVYNTTTTLGAVGIYFWNGATWVRASLPTALAGDSGKILRWNGTTAVWATLASQVDTVKLSGTLIATPPNATFTKVFDGTYNFVSMPGRTVMISVPGLQPYDLCYNAGPGFWWEILTNINNYVYLYDNSVGGSGNTQQLRVLCYRPSI